MSVTSKYRKLLSKGELHADPVQARAVALLEDLAKRLKGYKPGKKSWPFGRTKPAPRGIYLHGDVGRGKSMLMDLFFDVAPLRHKRRVHFHAFMIEVHDAIFEWRQMSPRKRARQKNFVKDAGDDPIRPVAKGIAQHATLLCFDEFQVTDVADAMILGRLFEALFEFGVVIVATSNREPDTLYEDGINRQLFLPFIELIKDRMELFHLDHGTDYRLDRIVGQPVYYTPLDAKAEAALDAAFLALTDVKRGEPLEIEVKGRTIRVPEQARHVARFSFHDLCSEALGAADYLALVEHFHTFIISGIPKLGPENRNEAKRFVTLIDSLYENHRRLVASAAAAPENLYEEGDGSFEFARTVSRLLEMQSRDYLESD